MARAFSLVELLVVITIIIVLVALVTPALDGAMYQAQLALDAGNLRGTVGATNLYAVDFKRYYPYRHDVTDESPERAPMDFNRPDGNRQPQDDRPQLVGYFELNKMFNDPFVKPVDLENAQPESWIQGTYAMWFGYSYGGAREGMFKIGDRFEWDGRHFDWLITDHDLVGTGGGSHSSHPDQEGVQSLLVLQDNAGDDAERTAIAAMGFRFTFSRWEAIIPGSIVANFFLGAPPAGNRGVLDLNFGAADGSVIRTNHVPAVRSPSNSDAVVHVPYHANGANEGARLQLPR